VEGWKIWAGTARSLSPKLSLEINSPSVMSSAIPRGNHPGGIPSDRDTVITITPESSQSSGISVRHRPESPPWKCIFLDYSHNRQKRSASRGQSKMDIGSLRPR
jgi:hypothetical protein